MAKARSDKEEIVKYVKFFAYKAVQIIVHSRTGERAKTFSKANAIGVNWFNIALPGNNIGSEIQKEIKLEFVNKITVVDEPLWVYIYLKTSEGYESLLESWNISFTEKTDQNVKNAITVYNKLALLLKSVVSVSRSLPAYRLTRRKEKDFSFSYKICSREIEPARPARMPAITRIGSVTTQFGTLLFSVQFQTVIDCLSNANGKINASIDDPRTKILIRMNEDEALDSLRPPDPAIIEELYKAALDDVTSSTASLPTSFQSGLSQNCDQAGEGVTASLDLNDILQPLSIGDIDDNHRALAAFGEVSIENSQLELPEMPSTPPLLSLIQSKIDDSTTDSLVRSRQTENGNKSNKDEDNIVKDKELLAELDSTDSGAEPTAHAVGFEDDFVLVEVRPAFAPQTGDAGQLYRECQNPPKLDMFSNKLDFDSDNDDSITEQIERYENQLSQYDEFFRNLEHMKVN